MTKRISELPAAGSLADTDELEINQSGVSRKATRGQVIAGLASADHEHELADLADAGALAGLDSIGTAEIDAAAYASQADAVAGRAGPIAWQMHNATLFDEFKDVEIEIDPEIDELVTIR